MTASLISSALMQDLHVAWNSGVDKPDLISHKMTFNIVSIWWVLSQKLGTPTKPAERLMVSGLDIEWGDPQRRKILTNEVTLGDMYALAPGVVTYLPQSDPQRLAGMMYRTKYRDMPFAVKVFGVPFNPEGDVLFWNEIPEGRWWVEKCSGTVKASAHIGRGDGVYEIAIPHNRWTLMNTWLDKWLPK